MLPGMPRRRGPVERQSVSMPVHAGRQPVSNERDSGAGGLLDAEACIFDMLLTRQRAALLSSPLSSSPLPNANPTQHRAAPRALQARTRCPCRCFTNPPSFALSLDVLAGAFLTPPEPFPIKPRGALASALPTW
eukprot:365743-Chlamydomonas_euryale.AAC.42